MNKAIFEKLIKGPPKDARKRYIFINDNAEICKAILTVGFSCVYINRNQVEGVHTVESFTECVRNKANMGTSMMDYVFVLACLRKKTNDTIEQTLKANQLEYKVGAYTLFRDKEYLANYDRQDDLEKALNAYINRFEGPHEMEVDKEQFIKRNPDGRETGIMEKKLVDYIIESVSFFVVGTIVYIYHDGVFREDDNGIELKGIIQSLLYDKYINYRTINGVFRLLIEQQQVQKRYEDLNAYPNHWINFRNGFFDVKEQKLHGHSPKYLAINQIPHELNLKIQDEIEEYGYDTIRFLNHAIPDKADQDMLFQYIGYCMTKDTCMQRFMILKGTGGTGKSSVIKMIQNIIGLENTSSMSLQNLGQRFYPSQLRGKLLNACADIESGALLNVAEIKKATGEDLLIYERKGTDPTTFRSYAKLLFSANQIPLNMDEKSDAFYRRMLILVMDQKPAQKDLELDRKLEAEIDYSIWMALAGLKILYLEGGFRETARSREEVDKLHRAADTVKAFMDECTERQQGAKIKQGLLYEKYEEYCKGYGRRAYGKNSFYRTLEEKGYILKHRNDGRYVLDVTLRDDGFIDLGDEDPPL